MVRHTQSSHTKSLLLLLITVVIGVGLNFLGRLLNTALGLPLYLDNVGTLLTAMTGGLVPGITVGFFSNLINGLKDPNSTYYAVISILIAVAAVACKKKGVMTRFPQVLPVVLLFALIGGVVGGVLTWLINGKDFGEGYAVELAAKIGDTLSIGYCPQQRRVVLHLVLQVQFSGAADGDGCTEHATGVLQHEVDHLRRYLLGGTYQVALVLTVLVVDDNDELPFFEVHQCLLNRIQFQLIHLVSIKFRFFS